VRDVELSVTAGRKEASAVQAYHKRERLPAVRWMSPRSRYWRTSSRPGRGSTHSRWGEVVVNLFVLDCEKGHWPLPTRVRRCLRRQ
jgi:hypothetical protein